MEDEAGFAARWDELGSARQQVVMQLICDANRYIQGQSPIRIVRLPETRWPRAWVHAWACESSEKEGAKRLSPFSFTCTCMHLRARPAHLRQSHNK
eukprot:COSAG05_NODE_180_length_14817_cov_423.925262_7_plen_96_part_00